VASEITRSTSGVLEGISVGGGGAAVGGTGVAVGGGEVAVGETGLAGDAVGSSTTGVDSPHASISPASPINNNQVLRFI
jgi:hypothetical protein